MRQVFLPPLGWEDAARAELLADIEMVRFTVNLRLVKRPYDGGRLAARNGTD